MKTKGRNAVSAAVLGACAALSLAMTVPRAPEFGGEGSGDSIILRGRESLWDVLRPDVATPAHGGSGGSGGSGETGSSRGDADAAPTCPLTRYTQGKYWVEVDACLGGTEWTPWFEDVAPGEPPPDGPAAPPGQQVIVTAEDVQSLPIDSGGLVVQPAQPWVLVNLDTVVMTGARAQVLETVVLGVPVRVRVVPVEYAWDFGDGSAPVVTTDPGAPWPEHTVAHAYTAAGAVQISLTTQWEAQFQPVGTAGWLPVTGRASTTEVSEPIEVVTATPRLVRNG